MAKKATTRSRGKFYPCHIMELPPEQQLEAARNAIALNPANAPRLDLLVPALSTALAGASRRDLSPAIEDPQFLTALTGKYWRGPVRLTVSFLDNPSSSLRNRVLSHFNAWGEFSDVRVDWTASGGDIRIARNEPALYSYLGTDIRLVPMDRHTMMLGGYSDRTPDREIRRSGCHELGHSLGFIHEHLRRELVRKIVASKAYAYYARTQGWSRATVDSNVLRYADESTITGSEVPDQDSLMCYQIPGEITVDGKPIPGGVDFSPQDKVMAGRLWPKTTPPPPPDRVEVTIPRAGKWVWQGE